MTFILSNLLLIMSNELDSGAKIIQAVQPTKFICGLFTLRNTSGIVR